MQLNDRETHHLQNAIYFTAIRGAKPSTRVRREFIYEHQAFAWAQAQGDGRTMIYAVSAEGSAHIRNA